MANYWKILWQKVVVREGKADGEVKRIAVLQQAAADRRAEYASEQERTALTGDPSSVSRLSSCRERMAQAESAHTAALQIWENKQSRQKSR